MGSHGRMSFRLLARSTDCLCQTTDLLQHTRQGLGCGAPLFIQRLRQCRQQGRGHNGPIGNAGSLRGLLGRANAKANGYGRSVAARMRGIAPARSCALAERVPVIPTMLT